MRVLLVGDPTPGYLDLAKTWPWLATNSGEQIQEHLGWVAVTRLNEIAEFNDFDASLPMLNAVNMAWRTAHPFGQFAVRYAISRAQLRQQRR